MNAVGDCILARPFVRELAHQYDLSLETPFAQLFADLPIKRFVRAKTNVAYVTKAVQEYGTQGRWRGAPKDADGNAIGSLRIAYDLDSPVPLTRQLENLVAPYLRQPINYEFDLPVAGSSSFDHPYAVIRPIVHRKEFPIEARNPLPVYMEAAAYILRRQGFKTVTIANHPHEEVQNLNVDVRYEDGQLTFVDMMTLVSRAAVVVTPPGFAGLMGVAARRPHTAVVWGARGALDNPTRIFDRRMPLDNLENFSPHALCNHSTATCECDKTIRQFHGRFAQFAERAWEQC